MTAPISESCKSQSEMIRLKAHTRKNPGISNDLRGNRRTTKIEAIVERLPATAKILEAISGDIPPCLGLGVLKITSNILLEYVTNA
jgi:hypothetical protein